MWHGYVLIKNLALDNDQRDTLISAVRALGQRNNDPMPALRMHSRIKGDNTEAILEASFDPDNLSLSAFKTRIADIFGILPSAIGHTVAGNGVTLSNGGTDYLYVELFGGLSATREESLAAEHAYRALDKAGWGDV